MSAKTKVYPWDLPNPYHESPKYLASARGEGSGQSDRIGELVETDDQECDCGGWEIVCPDGRVRHYPFHGKGDADADAEEMLSRCCQVWKQPSELKISQPPCPEGRHTVRAVNVRGAAVPLSN